MHFVVRGRDLNIDAAGVVASVKGQLPEKIDDHLVQIEDTEFPTKQAFELATGWNRTSFTSIEAIHVMIKLGFSCRIAAELLDGSATWKPESETVGLTNEEKVQKVQVALNELQEAVTSLSHLDLAAEEMIDE